MAELKACPFCGGEAKIRNFATVDLEPEIDVFCTNCGGQTFVYGSKKQAIEAWNRRNENVYTPDDDFEPMWKMT